MGLLSKLFGDKIEKEAKDLFNSITGNGNQANNTNTRTAQTVTPDAKPQYNTASSAPSGDSWGEAMPAEENQFSFNGTYDVYFDNIFRAEFPEYLIEKAAAKYMPATVFTFMKDGRKALVVEVISERSEPQKLRKSCAAEGIPYLRYYYDHKGWWNTRSYVVNRTRGALNG